MGLKILLSTSPKKMYISLSIIEVYLYPRNLQTNVSRNDNPQLVLHDRTLSEGVLVCLMNVYQMFMIKSKSKKYWSGHA